VRSLNLHDYRLLSVSVNGDLALLSSDDVLATVPISGGAPRALVEHVIDADWTPDGKDLAVIRRVGAENVIEYPIGRAVYHTSNGIGALRVSPKDDAAAFFEFDAEKRTLVLLSRTGTRRVLSGGWIYASRLAWTPGGREIWFSAARGGNDYPIWSVDLRGRERLIERVPGRLYIEDIAKDGRVLVDHDFSRAGIGYHEAADPADRDLSWLDLAMVAAISDDGAHILFSETGEAAGGHRLVYLRDTGGADAIRLGEGLAVALSPDGKNVLALSEEEGKFVILPTGAGQPRTIPGPGKLHEAGVIFNDGRILCWAQEPGRGSRLYLQDGGEWKPISPEFGDTRAFFQAVLSPNGDRVAALHGPDLLIVTTATGEVRALKNWPAPAQIAGWTADAKSLYAARPDADSFQVDRWNLASQRAEPWKRLEVKFGQPFLLRLTPDGSHYTYTYQRLAADAFVVMGLR
jgi:hypothetical protein